MRSARSSVRPPASDAAAAGSARASCCRRLQFSAPRRRRRFRTWVRSRCRAAICSATPPSVGCWPSATTPVVRCTTCSATTARRRTRRRSHRANRVPRQQVGQHRVGVDDTTAGPIRSAVSCAVAQRDPARPRGHCVRCPTPAAVLVERRRTRYRRPRPSAAAEPDGSASPVSTAGSAASSHCLMSSMCRPNRRGRGRTARWRV